MRNSSLNKWKSAEDVTGLKLCTEVESPIWAVGERPVCNEAKPIGFVECTGVKMLARVTTECENHSRRKPKDFYATFVGVELVGT